MLNGRFEKSARVSVSVHLHRPPADRTKAATLLVLSVSIFLLVHNGIRPVCHTRTCVHVHSRTHMYSHRLLSSLEAKAQTQSIHVWPWEEYFWPRRAIFSRCFHINAFLFQLGSRFSDRQLKPLGPTETRSPLWEHPLLTTQYFEATEVTHGEERNEKPSLLKKKRRVWRMVLPVTCNNWGKACLRGRARWYICNSVLLLHGLNRHSEQLPQYPDMFMDLYAAVQRSEPKETTDMKETREKGSKSKREHRDGWGDEENAAVGRWMRAVMEKRTTDGVCIERGDIMDTRDGRVMQVCHWGRNKQRDCDRKLSGVMESGEWEAHAEQVARITNVRRLKESLHQQLMITCYLRSEENQ